MFLQFAKPRSSNGDLLFMIDFPDTNVLVRFANCVAPQHAVVLSSIEKLKNGDKIYIIPQNCVEFPVG